MNESEKFWECGDGMIDQTQERIDNYLSLYVGIVCKQLLTLPIGPLVIVMNYLINFK